MADLKKVLESLYKRDESGVVSMEQSASKPSSSFVEAVGDAYKGHEEKFPRQLEDLMANEGANPVGKVEEFLKSKGLDGNNFEFSKQGSTAAFLRYPATDEYPFGIGVRLSASPKETETPKHAEALQPIAEANLDGLDVKIVPRVPSWEDVKERADLMNISLEFEDINALTLASLGDDTYDSDVNNKGNLGFVLNKEGNPVAMYIDPGAVVKADEIKPKKLERLSEMKEEFKANVDVKSFDYKGFQAEFAQSGLRGGVEAANKSKTRADMTPQERIALVKQTKLERAGGAQKGITERPHVSTSNNVTYNALAEKKKNTLGG